MIHRTTLPNLLTLNPNITEALPETHTTANYANTSNTDTYTSTDNPIENEISTHINNLDSNDANVRASSINSLRYLISIGRLPIAQRGVAVGGFINGLRSNNLEVRRNAARALEAMGENIPNGQRNLVVRTCLNILQNNNENEYLRSEATSVLRSMGNSIPEAQRTEVATTLINQTQSNSLYINISSILALGVLSGAGVIPNEQREAVTTTILNFADRGGYVYSQRVSLSALAAMGNNIPSSQRLIVLTALVGALEDPELEEIARGGLNNSGHISTLHIINQFGQGSSASHLRLLIAIGRPAIPGLLNALQHENPVIRANAAQALAQIAQNLNGPCSTTMQEQIVRGITGLLNDQAPGSHNVRSAACNALMVMGIRSNNQTNGNPALAGILRNIALPRLQTLIRNERREEVIAQANMAIESIE